MLKVNAIFSKFDNVHFDLARVVLATIDKLPVVYVRLRRKSIGGLRVPACRPVDQGHTVVVDRFPMPMDEQVGLWHRGWLANPAVSV